MKHLHGYVYPQYPNNVCHLVKSLYGLKQAPHARYQHFVVYISSLDFQWSSNDNSLFTYHNSTKIIYLLLYVDDIILTASDLPLITRVISRIFAKFSIIDLQPLSFFSWHICYSIHPRIPNLISLFLVNRYLTLHSIEASLKLFNIWHSLIQTLLM